MKSTLSSITHATKIVNDQRWVHCNELEHGMYVLELDVPWEKTSFMFQGFPLDSIELVEAVRQECEYALVQTSKVARYNPCSPSRFLKPPESRGVE